MALFRENFLDTQEEDVRADSLLASRVGPSNDEPNEDDDLEYSDDDLGENTEVTPLGDDIDEDDVNAIKVFGPADDDDDLLTDDDDDDWDTETDLDLGDEDEVVDITTSQQNDPDDDDLIPDDDDDDLLSDDDDDLIPVDPDDEEVLDDDEPLDLDEGIDPETSATDAPQMLDNPHSTSSSRREARKTGRILGHEPGLPGFGNEV